MKRSIIAWLGYAVTLSVCSLTMIKIGYPISTYQYWIVLTCIAIAFICGEEREIGRRKKKN